jgi:hypothetical protein
MTDRDENADLADALEASIKADEQIEESTVQTDEQSEAVEAEAVDQPEVFEIPEELQPVSAWKEEARQAWESIASNQEYHDGLRQLRNQFDSDYQYRTQLEQERAELAQRAGVADQLGAMAQQYGDLFQGRNPMDVIGNYLYYGQKLAQDPQGTIQALAQQYGVDLNQVVQDQPYIDDTTKALMERYEGLERQLHERQTQEQYQQAQAVLAQANAFESEVDAEGNPAHPYVPQVANHMVALLQSGQEQDLKSAYETACWMNPEVRANLLKEQESGRKQQQTVQAEKAKAAARAKPRPGKSSVTAPKGVEDIGDALDKAIAEQSAA